MKIHVISPLALLGARLGYNRPLDRHDWDGRGGHVPNWAGRFVLAPGEMRRFVNLTQMDGAATHMASTDFGTTKRFPLGTLGISDDGRLFRYASVGATDLVAGSIYQSAAPIPNHLAVAPAAAVAAGTYNPVPFTPGATGGAANLYEDGTLMIDTTPGNGYAYRIAGHPAITASVAFNLQLFADDPIIIALTTSSRWGLHHNPYKTVIVAATTVTAMAVGGAIAVITGNGTTENYGWLQTRGPFAGLINGTPAVGTGLVTSATTAGALDVAAVAAEINVRIIARAMQVGVSGKNNAVFLTLD